MRIFLLSSFLLSSIFCSAKVLHVRYVAQCPAGLSAEEMRLLPSHWDLYLDGDRFRLEEKGMASTRVWLGSSESNEFFVLLNFLGESLALRETCVDGGRWKKGSDLAVPAALQPLLQGADADMIAGEEAQVFQRGEEQAWLSSIEHESWCALGFPRLPLAFLLPDSPHTVWMVAEQVGASAETIAFDLPAGYRVIERGELGGLLPDLSPAE
jgi:hypothetical protein